MIRILHLLKSQLGFNFSGSAHNTHEEIHQREGTTRHTASGATVVVAPTMAKVQVRGQEGEKVEHGKKVYYKTPAMDRKKKGTIVGGSHEEGYVIQPVRQGYTLRPPQVAAQRDHIWTEDEHQVEKARSGARETTSRGGSTISIAESNRRAEAGQQRAQLDEGKVLTSPLFVGKMKGTLAHLASTNGFNPQYRVIGGALYNDDQDANELYSEYVAAAMNSYRTETSKAPEADLEELRTAIANGEGESRILTSMLRAGKTAAIRHIVALTRHNQEHDSYDGAMEDDQESGMREIAGQAHHTPEHESDGARRAQLMQGIVDQLDALDDPIAASIVKMKFGLAQFDHGYKEQDIAAALNRANMPAPDGDRWDADQVKERMASALANLGRTRGVQELRGLVKSLQELQDLRKAMAEYEEEPLIKSHIKQYMKQDGTVVTEHDDRRIRKHSDVVAHENAHGDKVHPGSKLQHGEDLMNRLREKGWKEKETHPVKKDSSLQAKGKEDLPEPSEVKGANKENPALVSAQRIITKMHEAAKSADDPVAALTAIHTSRANPYLKAVDDEREKLLAHFGHKVDRDATASKFEKDGHTIVMDKDRVHFAGADPDKAKGQVTSIAGRRQVEETDTGKKDAKFIIGRENKAYTAQLDEVKSNYALVEAHQLTTSHTIQGHINRAYPQEIQPRERERLSSQMQMANIMNDIKPELFGHSATAADGAPIVGKDGAVESGNGRTIALTEAYKRGLADKYKEWLKKEAGHFGLKPEDVDGMEQPMLVRVRAEDDANTDRAEFARKANQSSNLGSSPAEQAWSDSERIDDALLKKFTVDEDGEIYNEDNMDFINGFLAKLGRNEAASLRDADGDPNRKAIERIQNAVFTKVYGSSVLTELQAESAKPRIRNILRALNACVGDFAQVKGHDDLDVVPDMMEAIEYTLAHQGQSRDELEHTLRNAGSLNFTGDTPTFKTDYSVEMILAIADRTGSRNRLQNVFKGISHAIKTEVHERENPEVDMFSGPAAPKSKEKVVKQALEKVNGSDLQKAQSFYPRGLGLMLLKNHGGNHGRERALPTQKQAAEESPAARRQAGRGGQAEAQKEAAGGDRGERGAGREGQGGWRPGGARLLKSHVKSYTRQDGTLVNEHEDSRTKRELVAKHVRDASSLQKEEREHLKAYVADSKTSRPVLERVFHEDPQWIAGQTINLEATSFTSHKLSQGDNAGDIGWKSSDEALAIVERPQRGHDVDYASARNRHFSAGGEGETILAGRYRVKEVREVPEPGTNPEYGYKVRQYVLEEVSEPMVKARVRSYFRVTQHGALSEVMEHEDPRVRRYGQHIASTQDSADLHRLRRERFAHLPHWGDLDEKTRLKVLDAEEIAAGQHTRREARKQAAEAPMAEHLPGDQSGLLQMRMFKSIRIAPAKRIGGATRCNRYVN